MDGSISLCHIRWNKVEHTQCESSHRVLHNVAFHPICIVFSILKRVQYSTPHIAKIWFIWTYTYCSFLIGTKLNKERKSFIKNIITNITQLIDQKNLSGEKTLYSKVIFSIEVIVELKTQELDTQEVQLNSRITYDHIRSSTSFLCPRSLQCSLLRLFRRFYHYWQTYLLHLDVYDVILFLLASFNTPVVK